MSFNYPYAVKYSTRQMVARAYKEYTAAITEAYSRLMDMTTRVITEVDSDSNIEALVNDVINEYAEYGYTSMTMVPLNGGQVRLSEYLTQIANSSKYDMAAIDSEDIDRSYDTAITFNLVNQGSYTINFNDLLEQVNSNYHAIVVENAIAAAYDAGSSIAERISILRDTVSEKFKSAYTDVSNTLSQGVNKLKSGLDIIGYLEEKIKTSGVDDAAENGTNIENSEDVHFTGASPATGYAWYTAGNVIVTAVQNATKVAYNVVKTTIKGLFNLGKKLFSWCSQKLKEIVVDPKDVKEVNGEKGNHTFNGFYLHETTTITPAISFYPEVIEGPVHCDFVTCEIILQAVEGSKPSRAFTDITTGFIWLLKKKGDITLDVSNGVLDGINDALSASYDDLLTAAQSYTNIWTEDTILDTLNQYRIENDSVTIDIMYKFKPINKSVLAGLNGETYGSSFKYSSTDAVTCLNRLVELNNSYCDISNTEADLYAGFVIGIWLTHLMLELLITESGGTDIDTEPFDIVMEDKIEDLILVIKNDLITNADFLDLVTTGKVYVSTTYDPNGYIILPYGETLFQGIIDNIFTQKHEHPFDYGFFPYSRNYASWFDPSFELIPDETHQNKFDTFVTTAVIVAVVATIGIVALVKLKKHANMLLAKAMGAEWDVTEKAQKGTLTNTDIKKWKKAKRKANRMNWLNGNLLTALPDTSNSFQSLNNYDDVMTDLTPVISLITG